MTEKHYFIMLVTQFLPFFDPHLVPEERDPCHDGVEVRRQEGQVEPRGGGHLKQTRQTGNAGEGGNTQCKEEDAQLP